MFKEKIVAVLVITQLYKFQLSLREENSLIFGTGTGIHKTGCLLFSIRFSELTDFCAFVLQSQGGQSCRDFKTFFNIKNPVIVKNKKKTYHERLLTARSFAELPFNTTTSWRIGNGQESSVRLKSAQSSTSPDKKNSLRLTLLHCSVQQRQLIYIIFAHIMK